MKLIVVGTGSKGNCYLLTNGEETLILEAGMPFLEVKKALDFKVTSIVGLVCSHAHLDHAGHLKEYTSAGIKTFTPWKGEDLGKFRTFGNFTVFAFPAVHDVPCFSFIILHREMGRMAFIVDTELVRFNLHDNNLDHILVEANYDKRMVSREESRWKLDHIVRGHMELQTTKQFLEVAQTPKLKSVVLIHLSDTNSDNRLFHDEVAEVVNCPVYIAEKGLTVELK